MIQTGRWGTLRSLRPLGSLGVATTGISTSSQRGISLSRPNPEGRRRLEGHLEPWWTPQSHREDPFGEPKPDTAIIDAEFARDIESRVLCHYITHYDLPELEGVYMSGLCPIAPDNDIEALFGRHRRLSRWWAFLWGAYADQDQGR